MKGFITGTSTPIISYYYCDKLRYFPNVWGGETFLSQDMLRFADSANTTLSQLNLSGLSCSNPGVNTYFQSSNNGQYQSIGSLGEEIFISSNSGSGNVYFSAANLYLNGTPIGGGGGVTDIQAGSGISVNQTTGSVTITNTGGGGSYGIDYLQAGSGISVTQVSIGPNVWQIDNTGGGGGGVTDIQAGSGISVNQNTGSVTITNASTKYIFPTFDAGSIGNGGTAIGQGSQIFIPGGNYQITYTITFDNNFTQQPYEFRMVRAYCFLYSNTYGQTNPYMVSNVGFYPSQVITYDSRSYQNCITATDYITINNDDSYYLGVYQDNGSSIGSNNIFLSAILIKDNNNNNNNNN
jgi:hypothetical protein